MLIPRSVIDSHEISGLLRCQRCSSFRFVAAVTPDNISRTSCGPSNRVVGDIVCKDAHDVVVEVIPHDQVVSVLREVDAALEARRDESVWTGVSTVGNVSEVLDRQPFDGAVPAFDQQAIDVAGLTCSA